MLLYLGAQESADASLAQLDRVTGYEPVGQGFESLTTRQQKRQTHQGLPFLFSRRHDAEPHIFAPQKCQVCANTSWIIAYRRLKRKRGFRVPYDVGICECHTNNTKKIFQQIVCKNLLSSSVTHSRATALAPCSFIRWRRLTAFAATWVQSPLRRGYNLISY